MHACSCTARHETRKVVLTGGPGAGKTAILEFMGLAFCKHVEILPEAAGLLFKGGFPRGSEPVRKRAVQRAIFHVQSQLEAGTTEDNAAIVVCDRGTPDGAAYWPGPGTLWDGVGTTQEEELARYSAVIHLRTPSGENGYNHRNPLRVETVEEALVIDARIAEIWRGHPGYVEVPAAPDFLVKARSALEIMRDQVPPCCRASVSRSFVV
ncbi:MAG TPA: ATP-binding protein [Longimicrobiales bacterium]|nr:ATP-binding protein [Longimicrobiales bacterium]